MPSNKNRISAQVWINKLILKNILADTSIPNACSEYTPSHVVERLRSFISIRGVFRTYSNILGTASHKINIQYLGNTKEKNSVFGHFSGSVTNRIEQFLLVKCFSARPNFLKNIHWVKIILFGEKFQTKMVSCFRFYMSQGIQEWTK